MLKRDGIRTGGSFAWAGWFWVLGHVLLRLIAGMSSFLVSW